LATQAQLAQYALNIAVAAQNQFIEGQTEPAAPGNFKVLYAAVILLAQAVLNSGGGTIPASLLTGKWSAQQSTTAPIQT
jgi:hypothetical protein